MIHGQEMSGEFGMAGARRELDALLALVQHERGLNFFGHKRSSLERRLRGAMSTAKVDSLDEYVALLTQDPEEMSRLLDALLVNVTSFFRGAAAWETLYDHLSNAFDSRSTDPIRVWCAGCSSGEEPYTIAMLLCELLGEEAFEARVTIHATDVDDAALERARSATYRREELESVPGPLSEKYFMPTCGGSAVRQPLRRAVVVERHDLLKDAPISDVDVLVCRNVLMYFDRPTQEHVLQSLRVALRPSGVMLLGRAEMLLSHAGLFFPIDWGARLFAPVTRESTAFPFDGWFTQVSERASAGVAVLDRELRVRGWSKRLTTLLGVKKSEIEGRELTRAGIDVQLASIAPLLKGACEQHLTCEHVLFGFGRSGTPVVFRFKASPLRGDSAWGVVVLVEEVS